MSDRKIYLPSHSNSRQKRHSNANISDIPLKFLPKNLDTSFDALKKMAYETQKKLDEYFPQYKFKEDDVEHIFHDIKHENPPINAEKRIKPRRRTSSMASVRLNESTGQIVDSLPDKTSFTNMKRILKQRNKDYFL